MTQRSNTGTASDLLAAATRQFAARGFYGVSIAAVADELGITKQALLHHFGSKEKLYSAVLEDIAARFDAALDGGDSIVEVFDVFYVYALSHKDDMALIARELLDNARRAETAQKWVLRGFLNKLVDLALDARPSLTREEALADIYVVIGAINYYAISDPTLRSIFGQDAASQLETRMPDALRDMTRARFR